MEDLCYLGRFLESPAPPEACACGNESMHKKGYLGTEVYACGNESMYTCVSGYLDTEACACGNESMHTSGYLGTEASVAEEGRRVI